MGLNPDMAVDAGKHSYFKQNEYEKYIPHTEVTVKEFYSKISNNKIILFYLTNPLRMIQAMEYTAEHAYMTSTPLGKYPRSYSEAPITDFNRFTYWSDFRYNYLPKNLLFIIGFYVAAISVSAYEYVKHKESYETREKIKLLWGLMFIGALQFPMPYIGNGQADLYKQLYLFNFIFDVMLVTAAAWFINEMLRVVVVTKKRLAAKAENRNKKLPPFLGTAADLVRKFIIHR
jgi:hypothetical protein